MKNIFKYIALSAITLLATSCDEDDKFGYGGADSQSGWVLFSQASSLNFVKPQGNQIIEIPFDLQAPVNTLGLDVTAELSLVGGGNVPAGVSVVSANVPVNTRDGLIKLEVNPSVIGTSINVTLTGTSRSNVIAGLENTLVVHQLNFTCAQDFSATYTGRRKSDAIGVTSYTTLPTFNPQLTGSNGAFTAATLWGTDFVALLTQNVLFNGQFVYPGTISVNNLNVVTVVGDEEANTLANGTFWGPGGTGPGTYNPCSDVIEYQLEQSLFTTAFPVEIRLTGNND